MAWYHGEDKSDLCSLGLVEGRENVLDYQL